MISPLKHSLFKYLTFIYNPTLFFRLIIISSYFSLRKSRRKRVCFWRWMKLPKDTLNTSASAKSEAFRRHLEYLPFCRIWSFPKTPWTPSLLQNLKLSEDTLNTSPFAESEAFWRHLEHLPFCRIWRFLKTPWIPPLLQNLKLSEEPWTPSLLQNLKLPEEGITYWPEVFIWSSLLNVVWMLIYMN